MLFNSLAFLVFLPTFLVLYFASHGRLRLGICIAGSYLFYGWWDWRFLGLILFSTVVDYVIGLALDRTDSATLRKRLLLVSVGVNLGLLGTFKYFDFFVLSMHEALGTLGWHAPSATLGLILPVGISFYTFQTMSYTIDVYRRALDPEKDFLRFATFVSFFPQLVAGPIVRASTLIPQLRVPHRFDFERFQSGFGLVLWGFFKKVAVADTLAAVVDTRFASPEAHTALSLSIAVVFYAFQIYCDFSGYSDIAIGIGRMLGLDFGLNFRTPYFSKSFSEFWTRWHISLSSWLRDYLYIPLGGNRSGAMYTHRNLMLTMLLGGLWHGASWNFVAWGALHGGYLILQRALSRPWEVVRRTIRLPGAVEAVCMMALVFFLTCVAWVFFRAESLSDACTILVRIASMEDPSFASVRNKFLVLKGALLIGILLAAELLALAPSVQRGLEHPFARIAAFSSALWLIAIFGTFDGTQFIYFQF